MTARSKTIGRSIIWKKNRWVYEDTGKIATTIRPCPHCGHKPVGVRVKVPADLSHTGKVLWRVKRIDYCIAPIVKALQEARIDMRGSCCGHGKVDGDIHLEDSRLLIIKQNADKYWKGDASNITT